VESIELHKDLDKIRVKTILDGMTFNIFAIIRQRSSKAPKSIYEFPISEVKFSESDEPSSKVLRLEMSDGKKFFCHRNRAEYRDPELIGAIFNQNVKKLDCMK
jgi:hypothetical protein